MTTFESSGATYILYAMQQYAQSEMIDVLEL